MVRPDAIKLCVTVLSIASQLIWNIEIDRGHIPGVVKVTICNFFELHRLHWARKGFQPELWASNCMKNFSLGTYIYRVPYRAMDTSLSPQCTVRREDRLRRRRIEADEWLNYSFLVGERKHWVKLIPIAKGRSVQWR